MSSHNQAESFPGRNYYKSRGVDWARFIPWLLAAFAVAAILAEVLDQLFRVGWYLILIVPLAAALCVAGMMNLAVTRGHCRNPTIAALAGCLAGIILYLGYFYCGMVRDFGPEVASHPEALPNYIYLRMIVERTQDVGAPQNDADKTPDNLYLNWGRSALELILVMALTTGAALRRSKKTYCESCRQWMVRQVTRFNPAQSNELMEALRVQSARSLAGLSAGAPFNTIPNLTLAVDFCSSLKDGVSRGCPVYLSAKIIAMAPKNAALDPFEQSKGKLLVRTMQLNGDEVAALSSRFEIFQTITGRSTISPPPPVAEESESADIKDVTWADITPAPPEHAGQVLSRKNVIFASLSLFAMLVGIFGGLGLVLWGVTTGFPDNHESVSASAKQLGIILISVGGACFIASLVMIFIDSSFFFNRHMRNTLRREIGSRTSVLVDANDPEALFVECVPKTNWGKLMLDNAGDVGLMVVDQRKREIRFEGDKERWRIPAAAITHCGFEVFVRQQGNYSSKIFYVVLQVNHRAGFWEAPIRPRGKLGLFSGARKKATADLLQAIQSILDVKPAQDERVTS